MREMAARIPDARFVLIDAGHSIHTRKPREFVAAVADFLST
jgi:pimeloyl-ACP methyl ester carboxylesterase